MHQGHPAPFHPGDGSVRGSAVGAHRRRGRIPTVGSWLILLTAAVALPLLAVACLAIWQMHLGARGRAEDQLRMQVATQQLTNNSQIGKVRKDIARVKTILRERGDAK